MNEKLNRRTTRNGWHFSLFTRLRESNIGAFCLRMRENCSVRLQMADLLGGCEFCHGFYEKYGLNFCSISPNSC